MFSEDRVDDFPLDAGATAVDDANVAKSALDGLMQVLFDHDVDVARQKRMEVDGIFDRDFMHNISLGSRGYNKPLMKYYVRTYGCQMNVADADEMGRHLKARGLTPTDDPDEASVLLVNT